MNENIIHLCRALAKHQDDLHKVIYNAAKLAESEAAENTQSFLIMQTPIIQGTPNQVNLTHIGNQEIDFKKVALGIQEMLKSAGK